MIDKIIKLFIGKSALLPREDYLLSYFAETAEEAYRELILSQIKEIRSAVRSKDGCIVKLQYGSKRKALEEKINFPLLQQESVVGRLKFSVEKGNSNVIQIIQINGLISMMEYIFPLEEYIYTNSLIVECCDVYLRSRLEVDRELIEKRIRAIIPFENMDVFNLREPALSEELLGAERYFLQIPSDYFKLCSVCDGFSAASWEFLGLRFRQVTIGGSRAGCGFILAESMFRDCILLAKERTGEWRLFLAKIDIEKMEINNLDPLSQFFCEAFVQALDICE